MSTQPTKPITHYLQFEPYSRATALCGEPDPIIDLNPYDGVVDCPRCLELWRDLIASNPEDQS
jgi:hypothetical protein